MSVKVITVKASVGVSVIFVPKMVKSRCATMVSSMVLKMEKVYIQI